MKNNELQNSGGIMLITGATSGFGEAIAQLAAASGYDLILCGRRKERLQALKESLGTKVLKCLTFDVCDEEATKKALQEVSDDQVPQVLINNAGLAVGTGAIDEGVYDDWNRMINTNVKGLLHVTRELTPRMQSGARIINIGSVAGKQAYPGGAVYNATKFAVDGLTKAMRMDLLPRGIQVAQVAPGAANTEFSLVRFKGDEHKAAAVYDGFEPLSAMDVAEAVLFVASRPPHVSIQDLLIMPAAQASVHHLFRNKS
jgi:3-hydroxy acid dehydrogenase / malonic semialdehyde reductase